MVKLFILSVTLALLAGCGTAVRQGGGSLSGPAAPSTGGRGGGYYLDDGPHERPLVDPDTVADAVPRVEPLSRGTLRPYTVMGRTYVPMTALAPYSARGTASWYGRRYHGKPTSSGERYDMYAMSAAHPTLPIPSYARVTNLANGKAVIVRVNDRGPFIGGRLIDVSYTAAYKLGLLAGGGAEVLVEAIVPGSPLAPPPATPFTAPPMLAVAPSSAPAYSPPSAPVYSTPVVPATPPPPGTTAPPITAAALIAPASAPEGDEIARRIAMAGDGVNYYLQIAAFSSRDNAEAYAARLRSELPWMTADQVAVYAADPLFRVQAGPYASADEARQTADRVGQSLGSAPMVVSRP